MPLPKALPPIFPLSSWKQVPKHRAHWIAKQKFADQIAEKIGRNVIRDKVILDCLPGIGLHTRSFLQCEPKKIICVEPRVPLYDELTKLSEADPRVVPFRADPYAYRTTQKLLQDEYLGSLPIREKTHVNEDLLVVVTVYKTDAHRMYINYAINDIGESLDFQKFGRVRICTICPVDFGKKFLAPIKSRYRTSTSVIAQAYSDIELIEEIPEEGMYPQDNYQVLMFTPKLLESKVPQHVFQFVIRTLFNKKTAPINKAVKSLSPGLDHHLSKLTWDTSVPVRDLEVEQIEEVAYYFNQDPFRDIYMRKENLPKE
ncbi:S-adenosyl-L-methionine-dependent methyltransferase, partial [Basidiobolus meristosporus CBS 931.73]